MIGSQAITTGNVQKLIGGVDYKGRICGFDAGVAQKPNWNIVAWDGSGVCLEACPAVNHWNDVDWYSSTDNDKLVCIDAADMKTPTILPGITLSQLDCPFYRVFVKECMFELQSTPYLGFCVLDDMSLLTNILTKHFKDLKLPAG